MPPPLGANDVLQSGPVPVGPNDALQDTPPPPGPTDAPQGHGPGLCNCCGGGPCCLAGKGTVCLTLQATGSPFPMLNAGLAIRIHVNPDLFPFSYPGLFFFVLLNGRYYDADRDITVCYKYFMPFRLSCTGGGKYRFEVGDPKSVPTDAENADCSVTPASYGYAGAPGLAGPNCDGSGDGACWDYYDFNFFLNTPGTSHGNLCGGYFWSIYQSVAVNGGECDAGGVGVTVPGGWFNIPYCDGPITFSDFTLTAAVSTAEDCDGVDFTPLGVEGSFVGQTLVFTEDQYDAICECAETSWDCTTVGGEPACVDHGGPGGDYPTKPLCLEGCAVAETYNCVVGIGCVNPGDGLGFFTGPDALANCNVACVPDRWNCVGYDCVRAWGGAYTSEEDCHLAGCNPPGDGRLPCCPDGTAASVLSYQVGISSGFCECLIVLGGTAAWVPGDGATGAYVGNHAGACGSDMAVKVRCIDGTWYGEIWCLDGVIAVMVLGNTSGDFCVPPADEFHPAIMNGSAVVTPSACCGFAENVSLSVVRSFPN